MNDSTEPGLWADPEPRYKKDPEPVTVNNVTVNIFNEDSSRVLEDMEINMTLGPKKLSVEEHQMFIGKLLKQALADSTGRNRPGRDE